VLWAKGCLGLRATLRLAHVHARLLLQELQLLLLLHHLKLRGVEEQAAAACDVQLAHLRGGQAGRV
jgi:hypothetical protein